MGSKLAAERLSGVWSAAPTPFTDRMKVDTVAVRRMVEHHLRLGVKGLFLAGTNGEGPWITDEHLHVLVSTVARCAKARLPIAVQVTDNSAARILDNIRAAKRNGADIAVIAPPYFQFPLLVGRTLRLYQEAIRKSPLPVGIYDRPGPNGFAVSNADLAKIYAEKRVILVKDSSSDPGRRKIALAARRKRPALRLLNGNEWQCDVYMKAGYDGLLLGGGVFNGYLANMLVAAATAGDFALVERLQKRLTRIMFAVYGGKKLTCWLSGEKKLLVEMGIFRTWKNFPDYPLTASCVKAIAHVLERDVDVLMPPKGKGHA
ncbi:MAG: dihydrodipicolinate synthase family protein [Candidatus Brocadiia bacterium]|jgi:4-hydroxy-tetrahydrodipicolinate synthase|nr:dihydrodipicolinate synthase family protein [Candidatus Brocadiia bacterium]